MCWLWHATQCLLICFTLFQRLFKCFQALGFDMIGILSADVGNLCKVVYFRCLMKIFSYFNIFVILHWTPFLAMNLYLWLFYQRMMYLAWLDNSTWAFFDWFSRIDGLFHFHHQVKYGAEMCCAPLKQFLIVKTKKCDNGTGAKNSLLGAFGKLQKDNFLVYLVGIGLGMKKLKKSFGA